MKLLSVLTLGVAISFSSLSFAQSSSGKAFSGMAVGVTGSVVHGHHTIDLEILGRSISIADDDMSGSSLGLSLEYLHAFSDWRVGPRLRIERSSFAANDRIGNKYVSFETSLELHEMHSLSLLLGYVATPRLMPYAFVGLAASHGTIGAKFNVLQYSVADTETDWIAGPTYGVGVMYRLSRHSELGMEYAVAHFDKRYDRCAKVLPQLCAGLPIEIRPKTLSFSYKYRF